MLEEKLSYSEAARQFEINDHGIIQRWERIYLEEGSEGLAIERRGRKSTGRPMKLQKEVGEDLDVLMELSDRIMVLCGGEVSGILDARKTDKNEVGMLMTRVGGKEHEGKE